MTCNKNIATNSLSYTGIVTLSQYVGKKKIKIAKLHNSGGSPLFSFLANCLAGNFMTVRGNWPTKIKVLERIVEDEKEQQYTYNSISGFIFLRTVPEIDASNLGESRVRYSFMIPRDLVENITNRSNVGLGLYTNSTPESEPENFAAFCSVGDTLSGELDNSSLLVDWELVISNANNKSGN